MDPNYFANPLQQLHALSSTMFFVDPLTHQQPPPVPPGVSYATHHTDKSPALTHPPLQCENHKTPPTPGGMSAYHANQCHWLIGGVPCGQCFPTFDQLIIHLARRHDVQGPAERKVVCDWCTHQGPCRNQYRRDAFRRHIATHLKISYPCNVTDCNKSFSRIDSLRLHVRSKHTKC